MPSLIIALLVHRDLVHKVDLENFDYLLLTGSSPVAATIIALGFVWVLHWPWFRETDQ
jgi:hypothetical protein